jgi:WD40 repeat protein
MGRIRSIFQDRETGVIAWGGDRGVIHVKDWSVGANNMVFALRGHTDRVTCVAYSPDGTILASTSKDGTIRLWKTKVVPGRRVIACPPHPLRSMSMAADGRTVATATTDQAIEVWDLATGNKTEVFFVPGMGSVNQIRYSPDGRFLAAATSNGGVYFLDGRTGNLLRTLMKPHSEEACTLAFVPDGSLLAVRDRVIGIILYDPVTGKQQFSLNDKEDHRNAHGAMAIAFDGQSLFSANQTILERWSLESGNLVASFEKHRDWITCVAISPDGKTVATGGHDHWVILWDAKTGRPNHVLLGHKHRVNSVTFSPDGRTLASGSNGGELMLWDVATGQQFFTLPGQLGPVWDIAFTPDGKTLVSLAEYGNRGEVCLWNAGPR